MGSKNSYQRLERFYRGLIGPRADQLALLKDQSRQKIARAVYLRFDQRKLLELTRQLNLTVDFPGRDFSPQPVADDAVLIDTPLAGRLSEHLSFNEGRIYIQSIPSYLVIHHLPIEPADYALDLCGAPGGKALHCYDRFNRAKPVLVNEYSEARRVRLVGVLRTYRAESLPLLGIAASGVCRHVVNEIPLILLDAPCSGEAHLVRNKKQLAQWRPRQSKMFALRQRAMAIAAIGALSPGGLLLYATCTVSPYENELMIQDLLAKFGETIELVPWPADALDEWPTGPDQFAVLDRVGDKQIDERIVRSAWRFWPAAFGEPFFAVLIRKVAATNPKQILKPCPLIYPPHKSKRSTRLVRLGPTGREFNVPASWPKLPPLPYLRLGTER